MSMQQAKSSDESKQAGFTLVELLIATSVLSVLLVMATVIMISIGNLYYKGVNQSRIQNNVRSLSDEVSERLQTSNGARPAAADPAQPGVIAYCIGDTRYTAVIGKQIGKGSDQSRHVLWRDKNNTPSSCTGSLPTMANDTPSSGGAELIAPGARLTKFSIQGTSPYEVNIEVVYGEDEVLCNANVAGDCNETTKSTHLGDSGAQIRCKGSKDTSRFCATAALNTLVTRRLKE